MSLIVVSSSVAASLDTEINLIPGNVRDIELAIGQVITGRRKIKLDEDTNVPAILQDHNILAMSLLKQHCARVKPHERKLLAVLSDKNTPTKRDRIQLNNLAVMYPFIPVQDTIYVGPEANNSNNKEIAA
jgi:hypothetical protein